MIIQKHRKKLPFCYLISENNVKIYEFNRLVKDLNGFTKEDFLKELEKNFIVTNIS
jgi:hypothetical protein